MRAIDAGAVGYLVKDSRPADLFRAIRTAAQGDRDLDGAIGKRLLDRIDSPDETLTARELEVLSLAGAGLSNRELRLVSGGFNRTVDVRGVPAS